MPQDLRTCVVCQQPLKHEPKLGEMIAHEPCRDYVQMAMKEAASHAVSAEKLNQEWRPTRWWRVIDPEGRLWMESSDEEENRQEAQLKFKEGYTLQHLWYYKEEEWRDVAI